MKKPFHLNDVPSQQPPELGKIYVVYVGEDEEFAAWIKKQLAPHGLNCIDYKLSVGGRSIADNYVEWNKSCRHVVLLASNKWREMSSYLRGELATIKFYQDKRADQYVFVLAYQPLEDDVMARVIQFNNVNILSNTNIPNIMPQVIEQLKREPEWKKSTPVSVFKAEQGLHDTGALPPVPLTLNDTVASLMTPNPQTFDEEQHDTSDLIAYWMRKGFRHFPVVNHEGFLTGFISLRDIFKQEEPDPEVLEYIGTEGMIDLPLPIPISQFVVRHTAETRLITLHPEDSVGVAVEKLWRTHQLPNGQRRISALPVVDDNDMLHGIVTYRDVLQKCFMPSGLVEDFMTDSHRKRVVCVSQDTTLKVANERMTIFRDLPVLRQRDERIVVGMISEYEVCKNLRLPPFDKYDTRKVPVALVMKHIEDLPLLQASDDIALAIKIFIRRPTLGAIVVREPDGETLREIISYVDILARMLSDHDNG